MLIDTKDLPRCIHRHSILTHPFCFRDGIPKTEEWWLEGTNGKKPKIGFLDIETTSLNANTPKAMMLCWYIKPEGSDNYDRFCIDPKHINDIKSQDKEVVKTLTDVMVSHKYDILVTFYGTGFDIKFMRSRALKHGIDFPVYGETLHLDLYYATKSKLKLHSNRLASVCEFFGIKGKTPLDLSIWDRAAYGDKQALSEIFEHNKFDVIILEQLYYKLRPFIKFTKRSL